jgi:hypothetical protein
MFQLRNSNIVLSHLCVYIVYSVYKLHHKTLIYYELHC